MSILRFLIGFTGLSVLAFSEPHTEKFGNIPLHFEPNLGQTDKAVQFTARTPGMDLYITQQGTVMVLNGRDIIRMKLHADKGTRGLQKLPGVSNYILGNDPKKWRAGVPHYARVESKDIYPGIDVVYYGNGRQVEYDFTVAPGADPDQIHLAFEGSASVKLNEAGDIVLRTSAGDLIQKRPRVYQEAGGRQVEIEARYLLNANQATFALARYDRTKPLVIDPMIVYSTYLGGARFESETKIAVDRTGAVYVVGRTDSQSFPLQGEIQSTVHGKQDIFVTKLSPAGNTVVYSTFLGGSQYQIAKAIAVDAAGAAYLTGSTSSRDFPTQGAFQTTLKGEEDAIAVKLSPMGGALEYSTLLGGTDRELGLGIAVDFRGSAYITGTTGSADFPTQGALQPGYRGSTDAFVTKINPSGSTLVYSTYLGGSGVERPAGIGVDSSGSAYVAGTTQSADFPTQSAIQSYPSGKKQQSVFVSKLNPEGKALVYSTYVASGSFDVALSMALDASGAVYVAGGTGAGDFPSAPPSGLAFKNSGGLFAFKINPAGDALNYNARLASGNGNYLTGLAIDSAGGAYVVGYTGILGGSLGDLPLVNPIQSSSLLAPDAFLMKINPQGSAIVYSTLLGGSAVEGVDFLLGDQGTGIAVDSVGDVYITGITYRNDFPTYNAIFPNYPGPPNGTANFVTKISNATDIRLTKVTIDPQAGVVYVDGSIRVEGPKPRSFFWVPGSSHALTVGENAPGVRGTFVGWSDGGSANHSVTTPSADTTYTAKYENVQQLP